MPLRRLCFFAMLATVVVFIAVTRLHVRVNRLDTSIHPHSRQEGTTIAADESSSCMAQALHELGPSYWALSANCESRLPVFLPVQSKHADDLAAGKLLVASRGLGDPNFAETVILLVHYDAKGVVGLILNRRTDVPLSRVLPGVEAAKGRSDPVYLGGPLETPAVFALLRSRTKLEGAAQIFGGVYLISTKALFDQTMAARPDPGVFRVYLGYAGWEKDQLRREVELGAWFIFQPDAKTVFSLDPDSLWSQMIQKTELKFARSESVEPFGLHNRAE